MVCVRSMGGLEVALSEILHGMDGPVTIRERRLVLNQASFDKFVIVIPGFYLINFLFLKWRFICSTFRFYEFLTA